MHIQKSVAYDSFHVFHSLHHTAAAVPLFLRCFCDASKLKIGEKEEKIGDTEYTWRRRRACTATNSIMETGPGSRTGEGIYPVLVFFSPLFSQRRISYVQGIVPVPYFTSYVPLRFDGEVPTENIEKYHLKYFDAAVMTSELASGPAWVPLQWFRVIGCFASFVRGFLFLRLRAKERVTDLFLSSYYFIFCNLSATCRFCATITTLIFRVKENDGKDICSVLA